MPPAPTAQRWSFPVSPRLPNTGDSAIQLRLITPDGAAEFADVALVKYCSLPRAGTAILLGPYGCSAHEVGSGRLSRAKLHAVTAPLAEIPREHARLICYSYVPHAVAIKRLPERVRAHPRQAPRCPLPGTARSAKR